MGQEQEPEKPGLVDMSTVSRTQLIVGAVAALILFGLVVYFMGGEAEEPSAIPTAEPTSIPTPA